MPVLVPDALGVLHYNGFTFPATTTVSPVLTNNLSEDNRNYKSSTYEITAECFVSSEDTYEIFSADTSTTNLMTAIRQRFSAVNGNFCFANWGYGTIVLNGAVTTPVYIPPNSTSVRAATTYNVTHVPLSTGPKVDILECRFVGYSKAIHLKIKFTFEIYNSTQAAAWTSDNRKLIEMSISRSWRVGESGYVTRETKGSVRYWVVFANEALIDNDYSWISNTVVSPLPQYQRTQQFDPDLDGRGFKFTITDTPIESPLPFIAPIRTMRMVHSVSSGFNRANEYFNSWMIHFDIDCEVLCGRSKLECMPLLSQMILERMQNVFGAIPTADGSGLFVPRLVNKHLLWNLHITDEVTSNKFNWEMDWKCVFSLTQMLQLSKVLSYPTSNPESNWATWLLGMFGIQNVSAPGMELKTIYRPVSAASGENTPSVLYDRNVYGPTIPYGPPAFVESGGSGAIGAPYSNYTSFQNHHRIESNSNTFTGAQGYGSEAVPYQPRDGRSASGGLAPPGTGTSPNSSSSYKVAPTDSRYITHGHAERVGAPPAIPTLVSYNGVPLVEIGKSATELTVSTIAGGIPVYRVAWYLGYAFGQELSPTVNPYQGLSLTLTEPQINEPAP